jgi:hypothetical protein
VTGAGDFAFDHDCCPQYSIERTWCAADCAGNETCFTQVISFVDQSNLLPQPGYQANNEENTAEKGPDTLLTTVSAHPNPATVKAFVTFELAQSGLAKVEVYSLNGQKVAQLFEANAEAGVQYRLELDAQNMATGVYLYRLTTAHEVITDRLIINK